MRKSLMSTCWAGLNISSGKDYFDGEMGLPMVIICIEPRRRQALNGEETSYAVVDRKPISLFLRRYILN